MDRFGTASFDFEGSNGAHTGFFLVDLSNLALQLTSTCTFLSSGPLLTSAALFIMTQKRLTLFKAKNPKNPNISAEGQLANRLTSSPKK